jgi:hypothetical protein
MSGRSLPAKALSGVFGLISAAGKADGKISGSKARATSGARNGMSHLHSKTTDTGIRQVLNRNVNAGRRFVAGLPDISVPR